MRPIFATIHLGHLAYNFRLLQQKAAPSIIMAVVKADAYGHGLVPVAETLFAEGCRSFAVTDADEGALLRTSLSENMANAIDIILLSGLFDENDAQLILNHGLIPVVSADRHLDLLQGVGFEGNVWLKLDTGMGRIGAENTEDMLQGIHQHGMTLAGIMSHLACADTPEHPLNLEQLLKFKSIQQHAQAPVYSLLNSAGIVAFSSEIQTDFVRPGLALYGAEPIPSRPLGLKPVMQLSGNVLQIREIQADDSVSYGATWTASKETHVAVVGVGYADGLPRSLSNQGFASHTSGLLPIVGRVCMDYCMLAVHNEQVQVGDEVVFFGFDEQAPKANDVAHLCHTISYELFTGINPRVTRRYLKEPS